MRRIVHAQRGLRHHGQAFGLSRLHLGHIGHVFHQVNAVQQLTHRAFDFGVALVANHDELEAFFVKFGHFHMHFGDQRASGIKHGEAASCRFFFHRLRYAVGAEHQRRACRHIG